jgi:hypothetical protein
MNVFGATTDGERRKAVTRIEENNEIFITNVEKIQKKQQESIKTLLEKGIDTQDQINGIRTLCDGLQSRFADPFAQHLIETADRSKSINNIISKLSSRVNSLEVYIKDRA